MVTIRRMATDFRFLNYTDTKAVYLQNLQLRSAQECELCLSAISAMEVLPSEVDDGTGQRLTRSEIIHTRARAEKMLGVFQLAGSCPKVIVVEDDLR